MIPLLFLFDFVNEFIVYFLKEVFPFVSFEKISVGEFLTFISSLVLAIITFTSVSIAKDSSKVANLSLLIQSDQLKASIKPNLIYDIPPFEQPKFVYDDIKKLYMYKPSDLEYFIKNSSDNISYDVSVTTFIYLDNQSWKKYYEYKKEKIDINNTFSENTIHYLNSENKLTANVPNLFFWLEVFSYDERISIPEIYTFITYKDKIENLYNDFYKFEIMSNSKGGRFVTINLNPKKVNENEVKEKWNEQNKYLK